jgi:hypothetical protein
MDAEPTSMPQAAAEQEKTAMWTRRHAIAGMACLGGASLDPLLPPPLVNGKPADTAPDTRGWASLLDVLPASVQAMVRQGRYAGDLTRALRDAIETGADFIIPPGVYPFAGDGVDLRTPGQRIVGTGGLLRRLPQRDGIGLLVSAANVTLYDLHCDGSAPATPSHVNDTVKVTGDRCHLVGLVVRGSWGSNLRIEGAQDCRIVRPILTDAQQNNIVICEAPARNIVIESPVCQRTRSQNNIFVTASAASIANGAFVSGIAIHDALCTDAGDSGIELGYHCTDSSVTGGKVINSVNPALLQRDGCRNRWKSIIVQNRRAADQHANYDGVAVAPQWEPASWNSDTVFEGVIVQGRTRRSAFYWGQSGIQRINCVADAYASDGRVGADDETRTGSGDMKAGDVSHIVIRGGRIEGFVIGDNWNFDAAPYVRQSCVTTGVEISRCDQAFSCYNITPIDCAIIDNRGVENRRSDVLLARASLLPTDARPDIGLLYDGNTLLPPAPPDPATNLLLTRDSRFMRVPTRGACSTDSFSVDTGRYRLATNSGRIDFNVTKRSNGIAIQQVGTGTVPVNVAIENGRLVLHQRGQSSPAIWVKISGPGIRPSRSPLSSL